LHSEETAREIDQEAARLVLEAYRVCFLFVLGLKAAPGFLWFLSFIFGGFGIPIYSVCVAYINDQLEKEALVSAAGGVLFVYGVSAAVSPVLAGRFMGRMGPAGLFWFIGGIHGLFVGFCVWRLLVRPGVPERIRGGFVALSRTTSALLHLNQRRKTKGSRSAEPSRWQRNAPSRGQGGALRENPGVNAGQPANGVAGKDGVEVRGETTSPMAVAKTVRWKGNVGKPKGIRAKIPGAGDGGTCLPGRTAPRSRKGLR
jgi:hypothetical protein